VSFEQLKDEEICNCIRIHRRKTALVPSLPAYAEASAGQLTVLVRRSLACLRDAGAWLRRRRIETRNLSIQATDWLHEPARVNAL